MGQVLIASVLAAPDLTLAAALDVPGASSCGHDAGAPMGRAAIGRYRAAFGQLLDCAAGDAQAQACIDGWLDGVGPLVPAAEQPLARMLLEYHLAQDLRGDPAPVHKACTG